MLYQTFCHIEGIGKITEQKLWQAGITNWSKWQYPSPVKLSGFSSAEAPRVLNESLLAIRERRPDYFTKRLPANEHWRIFPHFREETAFLDIETTGLGHDSEITTIALYDGNKVYTYVNGRNMDDFTEQIFKYKVIVSFNGKCFDVPTIEKEFHIKLHHAQIDLRYVLPGIGIKGGLKKCEKQMGICRGNLDGIAGNEAILLWHDYISSNNDKALETLLAYNIEDTVNLEVLLIMAYNLNLTGTPFANLLALPKPDAPQIDFFPDQQTLYRIRTCYPA